MNADLYHESILAEARRAEGAGRLERPDAVVERDNPLCGDRIRIEVRLDGGRIRTLRHTTRGCLLTRAAASLLAREAPGRTPAELRRLADALARWLAEGGAPPAPSLALFAPVRAVASRHDCVLLPFRAAAGLDAPGDDDSRPRTR